MVVPAYSREWNKLDSHSISKYPFKWLIFEKTTSLNISTVPLGLREPTHVHWCWANPYLVLHHQYALRFVMKVPWLCDLQSGRQNPDSISNHILPVQYISLWKWFYGSLMSTMGFLILVRRQLYVELRSRSRYHQLHWTTRFVFQLDQNIFYWPLQWLSFIVLIKFIFKNYHCVQLYTNSDNLDDIHFVISYMGCPRTCFTSVYVQRKLKKRDDCEMAMW